MRVEVQAVAAASPASAEGPAAPAVEVAKIKAPAMLMQFGLMQYGFHAIYQAYNPINPVVPLGDD